MAQKVATEHKMKFLSQQNSDSDVKAENEPIKPRQGLIMTRYSFLFATHVAFFYDEINVTTAGHLKKKMLLKKRNCLIHCCCPFVSHNLILFGGQRCY